MKISRTSTALATIGVLLIASVGIPALGQDRPESLLPPGFDDPVAPAPAPTAAPTRTPEGATPAPSAETPGVSGSDSGEPAALGNSSEGEEEEQPPEQIDLSKYELPDFARRDPSLLGPATPASLGLSADAFGRSDGRYLSTLMRRLDAPVASRWVSIALRRALLSRVNTPARVSGADFAAERAWLLVRMGEAVAARAVAQSVDVDDYTPKLLQVAMQAALATGDPAAVCALTGKAETLSQERGWVLARAWCAGLAGDASTAAQDIDRARKRNLARYPIDMALAEKLVGMGAQGRRAVTVEWEGVDRLTAWRYGLAMATGEEIPEALYGTAGPQVRYWRALSPRPDPRSRVAVAELAAAQGVFSGAALVDLYGEIEESGDGGAEVAVARDLRTAYTAPEEADRVTTMRQLWNEARSPRARYGRMLLTARAAARIAPSGNYGEDVDSLIGSMLSAGLDLAAVRWNGTVSRGSDAWAMLAVADPARRRVAYGDVDAYRNSADRRKAQMLLAGLAGLGRLSEGEAERMAQALDVQIGAQNPWTWAIDAAARRREAGTVVLLCGVGMQTRVWEGVPPEALFHMVASLRAVGLEGYARMIAAEAIARL